MSGMGVQALFKDASVLGRRSSRAPRARVLRFAKPFTGMLAVFLFVVCLDAVAGVIPPLLYRASSTTASSRAMPSLVVELALLAGLVS